MAGACAPADRSTLRLRPGEGGRREPMTAREGKGRPERVASVRRSVADAGKRAGARVALGRDVVFGGRAAGRFGILYYHRVTDPPRGLPSPTLNVAPLTF